jgi:hypothetical protein
MNTAVGQVQRQFPRIHLPGVSVNKGNKATDLLTAEQCIDNNTSANGSTVEPFEGGVVASNQARFVCVWIVQETIVVPDVTIAPHHPSLRSRA